MLTVKGCDYRDGGKNRVYTFSNLSTVVETPEVPGKARFRFYDLAGHTIHTGAVKQEMKAAIERYKTKWRLAK